MELNPKVQINGQVKTDSLGNVLERSTLLNIRTDDVTEAIQLFNQLRGKMDDKEVSQVTEPKKLTVADLFPNEETEECPECGNKLVQRSGRNGFFWGCKSYPNCRYTRQA
jgi:hypothetical protein